jgi:hypothetical protein
VGVNANVAGTLGVTGVATFSAAPIYSSLTASSAVATDASKGLVSVTNTGTGNNVLATAPTIASANLTTALTLTGASGTSGQALTSQGSGVAPIWTTISAAPGGSTTQLQYNNAGAFAGISGVTSDGTRITASTTIGVGGATPSTSGSGITFPATQSASSNANTLDDYEEGTWTPTIGGTATYFTQAGRYVKIGRIVVVNFQCEINALGTGSTTIMTGLPFNPISAPTMAGCIGFFTNLAVNTYFLGFYANVNGQVQFIGQQALDGSNDQPLAIFGNGTNIVGTLTYETS